tara:strand:+ start:9866 stop:10600 length:735 start_codon:yes stop_codon:yes gene_type:complete
MVIESLTYTLLNEDWWYDSLDDGRLSTCEDFLNYLDGLTLFDEHSLTNLEATMLPALGNWCASFQSNMHTMYSTLGRGEMVIFVHCFQRQGDYSVFVLDGTQPETMVNEAIKGKENNRWTSLGVLVVGGEIQNISDGSTWGMHIPLDMNDCGLYGVEYKEYGGTRQDVPFITLPTEKADFLKEIGFRKTVVQKQRSGTMQQENQVELLNDVVMFVQKSTPPRIYPASNMPYPKWLLRAFEDAKL